MKYLKIFILLLIVGLTACTIEDTNMPNTAGSVGKLIGTVRSESGAALQGVKVSTKPVFKEAVTDESGNFVIVAIPAGTFTVEASKEGYISGFADVKIAAGYASTVNITLKKKKEENNPPLVPHNPQPEDESTTNQTELTLHWECSDPDGDDLIYDVYFGVDNPPTVKKAEGIGEKAVNIGGLKQGTKYYWKVVARDVHGAETSGDVWMFTVGSENNPPNKPYKPAPEDNSNIKETTYRFSWKCSDPDGDELMYDFYLAEGDNELKIVAHNLKTLYFIYRNLKNGTHYRWKVVARDVHGAETSGDVWHFTVYRENRPPVAPYDPNPADQSILKVNSHEFSWKCYDPDGDTLLYDIYFSKANNPLILTMKNLILNNFQFNNYEDNMIYHWKVVAKDGHGGVTSSKIWSFTTQFGSDILLKDLLAFYPFNGDAKDAGPNKLNGVNHGARLSTDRFDRANSAFFFGAGDEYVELPKPTEFAFRGNFTIALWVKPDFSICKPFETHIDIMNKSGSNPNNSWNIGFATNLGPEFWVNNKFIGYDFVKLKNLNWNHLAIVFSKSRISEEGSYTLYLNGAKVGESKVLPAPTNINNFVRIGDRADNSSFGGWIDDVYFFNRALNNEEILQLMRLKH